MKKWKSIQELISILESIKVEIEARLIALRTPPQSFNDEVLLKYIETRSTPATANYVKSKGIKSSSGRVFAPNDVSALIKDGGNDVNDALLRIAREIFDKNIKTVDRHYG